MNKIKNSNELYILENKEEIFHLIPLTHLGNNFIKMDINEAFDYIYFTLEEKDHIKQITGNLFKFVRRNIKQQKNKLVKLKDSLNDALDCSKWKEYGDLLYTYHVTNTKGQNSIKIEDFEGNEITIPLDPKLDGVGNAKKFFTKYQKGKKGQIHIQEQIEICENEIEYFEAIEEQLEFASLIDAKEIYQELIKNKYLKAPSSNPRKKKAKETINITSFEFKGKTITFGKNNIQNDYITFKLAHKNDTWFHVQQYHGTHLIVNDPNPDEETIRLCANIAAYYSKGRYSSSVPVTYTKVSSLKKIPGSKLGLVQLTNYKTIYIDPDFDSFKNLLF